MAHFFSKVQFSPLFQPIFTPKTPPHIVLKKPFTGKPRQAVPSARGSLYPPIHLTKKPPHQETGTEA